MSFITRTMQSWLCLLNRANMDYIRETACKRNPQDAWLIGTEYLATNHCYRVCMSKRDSTHASNERLEQGKSMLRPRALTFHMTNITSPCAQQIQKASFTYSTPYPKVSKFTFATLQISSCKHSNPILPCETAEHVAHLHAPHALLYNIYSA